MDSTPSSSPSLPLASTTALSHPLAPATPVLHTYGTRKRQNSVLVPATPRAPSDPPPLVLLPLQAQQQQQPAPPIRRIKPLGCASPNAGAGADNGGLQAGGGGVLELKAQKERKSIWRTSLPAPVPAAPLVEFPPKHVVLHPDDASNKIFLAVGRAFTSVDNCAMTVKDLAELAMKNGLGAQNASAASQAITFFIRAHLNRCEAEDDFPLLLRHTLSGTPKDDELAPALYSRSGGNVSKDKHTVKDENGNDVPVERLTSFRRGTIVWYLSKAAGAPCPFARKGIALRDFTDMSCITSGESRRGMGSGKASRRDGSGDGCHSGMKRKRESLRRRTATGAVTGCSRRAEDEDVRAGRKPPKIKLTLRLKPCLTLTAMREKPAESSTSSDSESNSESGSDSDSEDEAMSVDDSGAPPRREASKREPVLCPPEPDTSSNFSFPPYPIQRRISIPPYTPSEEVYPHYYPYTSPSTCMPSSTTLWGRTEDAQTSSYPTYRREPSVPLSVASPPPDSDMEYDEDDDDEGPMSPVIVKKEEEQLHWLSSFNPVKLEPIADDASKRSSLISPAPMVKLEELDFDSLSLSLNGPHVDEVDVPLSVDIKQEEVEDEMPWGQPVDITPVDGRDPLPSDSPELGFLSWQDTELLGPDSVHPQDFDGDAWPDRASVTTAFVTPAASQSPAAPLPRESAQQEDPVSASGVGAYTDPGYVADHEHSPDPASDAGEHEHERDVLFSPALSAWHGDSVGSPDTESESLGPGSPPSFGPEEGPALLHENARMDVGLKQQLGAGASVRSLRIADGDLFVSECSTPWERGMLSQWDVEEHLMPLEYTLPAAAFAAPLSSSEVQLQLGDAETPLSPQEEEVFQALCLCAEEGDARSVRSVDSTRTVVPRGASAAEAEADADAEDTSEPAEVKKNARPLRRSKRVADATATQQARARLRKRT